MAKTSKCMKCHYEVLEIERDSTSDDIKKSYRKLALKWHPDKNLENEEEAKLQFQLVQQAYDVLSDPQERSWYDKHREAILKGGLEEDYKDDSLNVFQYFNSSCYSGYNDSENGFYTVFRDVFSKIDQEDEPFRDEEAEKMPTFGKSDSIYEEVVHDFYASWMCYCTSKTYSWLDKFNILEAPNHRVLKLMERENKKIRETARKKRNEEIRNLVEFVRKRDKRVLAYRKKLQEKSEENAKKMQEQRVKTIRERKENLANEKFAEFLSFEELEEQLKAMETEIDQSFGKAEASADNDENESDENSDVEDPLYCISCDKAFKSEKSKLNHEKSKKHIQNFNLLKSVMEEEQQDIFQN